MKGISYSKTPLAKKLGIKEGFTIKLVTPPSDYFKLLGDFPESIQVVSESESKKNLIHYFVKSKKELEDEILQLKDELYQNGALWISWPKMTSKVETDLNGNMVRKIGLDSGLVDIKVCAINGVWSGLKFVIHVKNRHKL
ncbi:MAG: DUF3052 domain-containing protein [Flavobacteriaceae bacterium]|nr:DUF3052 domain-containing protein [Flavobacteriaceae bacterium]